MDKPVRKLKRYIVSGSNFVVPARYDNVQPIGYGAYGVVCSAVDTTSGMRVAIKKIKNAFRHEAACRRVLREIKLLRNMRNENVLPLVDVLEPDSLEEFFDVYVVTELMDTDLHQIIASPQPLSVDHLRYFIYQVLRGLKYVHSASVIHRDIKPSNLLINANCDLKIADFGLARTSLREESQNAFLTQYVATRWYRAPEIMLSRRDYTNSVDIWAVGCVLAELIARKPLFPGANYMEQLRLIIKQLGTPSDEDIEFVQNPRARKFLKDLPVCAKIPWDVKFPNTEPLMLDLLDRMLVLNPERRISAADALAHPFMGFLHDPADEPECPPIDYHLENEMPEAELKGLMLQELRDMHPDLDATLALPKEVVVFELVRPREKDKKAKDATNCEAAGVDGAAGGVDGAGGAAADAAPASIEEDEKVSKGEAAAAKNEAATHGKATRAVAAPLSEDEPESRGEGDEHAVPEELSGLPSGRAGAGLRLDEDDAGMEVDGVVRPPDSEDLPPNWDAGMDVAMME